MAPTFYWGVFLLPPFQIPGEFLQYVGQSGGGNAA